VTGFGVEDSKVVFLFSFFFFGLSHLLGCALFFLLSFDSFSFGIEHLINFSLEFVKETVESIFLDFLALLQFENILICFSYLSKFSCCFLWSIILRMILESKLSVSIFHLLHWSIFFKFEHLEWIIFLIGSLRVDFLEEILLLLRFGLILFEELFKESVRVCLIFCLDLFGFILRLLVSVRSVSDSVGRSEGSSEGE